MSYMPNFNLLLALHTKTMYPNDKEKRLFTLVLASTAQVRREGRGRQDREGGVHWPGGEELQRMPHRQVGE